MAHSDPLLTLANQVPVEHTIATFSCPDPPWFAMRVKKLMHERKECRDVTRCG